MICVTLCLSNFFFFQAEDGIRDIGVTGVQTCALPICILPIADFFNSIEPTRSWAGKPSDLPGCRRPSSFYHQPRSEERRVGKECRYRRTTDHKKKKNRNRRQR